MRKPYQTQTHLHASYEQFSSMRSHAAQAQKLGYDVLFITEHDVRMNYMQGAIREFFLKNEGCACDGNDSGWYDADGIPGNAVSVNGEYALELTPGRSFCFASDGEKHQASLIAELTLKMKFFVQQNASFRITILMSQREDDLSLQKLCYEYGNCGNPHPKSWCLPLCIDESGWATLPISEDALRFDPFGLDNAFCTVVLETFCEEKLYCFGFVIERKYTAEACRQRQQLLADRIGEKYGMKIYVADEISLSRGHRNSYSLNVPVFDYEKYSFHMTTEEASRIVTSMGGTLCYNHMFELWKNESIPAEEHNERIRRMADILIGNRCEGAHLIEVGFPMGRAGFSLSEHLRVWDTIGCEGVRITGVGDSDCHNSNVNWVDGNNFCTWFYADSHGREDIEAAMRSGNAYFGDPFRWRGDVSFTVGGGAMGDVISHSSTKLFQLHLTDIREMLELKLIAGGEEIFATDICDDAFSLDLSIKIPQRDCVYIPVRFELWARDGRGILFSNPVYVESQATSFDSNR